MSSTCISGFRGTGDVDAGAEIINDDPVAMYLDYHGVLGLDIGGVYFVGLVDSLLL